MKYINIIKLARLEKCQVLLNEPLCRHTSFRIGGMADVFIFVSNISQLSKIIKTIYKKENNPSVFVLGNGTNLIVGEKGFRGVILKLCKEFNEIKINGNVLSCGSGASLASVCVSAMNNNLTGLEFAWGIPGTCGGAAYMNAGAYNGEVSKIIKNIYHVNTLGEISFFDELKFAYRKSDYTNSNLIITSVDFLLNPGEKDIIKEKMKELILKRKSKQPIKMPSAGSVFKRPSGYFVGTLIEECGLKGFCIGGAQVSEKHAGFIVNRGDATAKDVLKLIEHIQNTVYKKIGRMLELEVKILPDVL